MLGIDLGGTRIKGVIVNSTGLIIHQTILPTNDNHESTWKYTLKEVVNDLIEKSGQKNIAVGISAPGLPDKNNKSIAFMPGRMEGLENFIWEEFLGLPTFILNDGVAALVAEAKFGVAAGQQNVAMFTLGTGVGGAMLINGFPYGGMGNKAGHFGHMVVDYNGDQDVTGMPGSLEECIGNYNILKRSNGRFSSTHELVESYNNGDPFATEIWLKSVNQLAIGLASIINIISPEMIVLGGGIVEAGEALFTPLNDFLDKYEWRPGGHKCIIVKAQFGEVAGAIGAACFAEEKNKNK
jgi:glucokinase